MNLPLRSLLLGSTMNLPLTIRGHYLVVLPGEYSMYMLDLILTATYWLHVAEYNLIGNSISMIIIYVAK